MKENYLSCVWVIIIFFLLGGFSGFVLTNEYHKTQLNPNCEEAFIQGGVFGAKKMLRKLDSLYYFQPKVLDHESVPISHF